MYRIISSCFLVLPFILPLSSHCLLWSFSVLSLGYAVRSFSCLKCCACLLWYIDIWPGLHWWKGGAVPVWWKTVIWCGRTAFQRTGASYTIFPGTAVLLIGLSTPLQRLSDVLLLQQVTAQRSQGELLSAVSIYLAETVENLVIRLIITPRSHDAILLLCARLKLALFSEVTFTVPRQYHTVSLLLISSVTSELLWIHTSYQSLSRLCGFFKNVSLLLHRDS